MRRVAISARVVTATPDPLSVIETMGRICYQTHPAGDPEGFARMLLRRGHESVIEHVSASVIFTVDRGVTHETVRHRLAAFSQESTRFCCYIREAFGKEIQVVEPPWLHPGKSHDIWVRRVLQAEEGYFELLEAGEPPEFARSLLPTCLKAEIGMTCNAREWRHVMRMRFVGIAGKPHPQMKEAMSLALPQLRAWCPVLFEDIE